MINFDRFIVEITNPSLALAVRSVRKIARRPGLLKMGPRTIFPQAVDFMSARSWEKMVAKLKNVGRLMRLCRGRFFFETEGLNDPYQIMRICEKLRPQAMSVDHEGWGN